MTISHDHNIRHSVLIAYFISVVIANSHFTLHIYSLSGLLFILLTLICLLILIEFALRKKGKNFCVMEFDLLSFLKLRTAAPSADTDSFTFHLRRNA